MKTTLVVLLFLSSPTPSSAPEGHAYLTYGGFTLGTVTLQDVQARLGPAPLTVTGDAGSYEAALCYHVASVTVRFTSGELGGSARTLLGFELQEGRIPAASTCLALKSESVPPLGSAIAGIKLGMSRSAFARSLGPPLRETASSVERVSCGTRVTAGVTYDVCVFVEGSFIKDHLSRLAVHLTETH